MFRYFLPRAVKRLPGHKMEVTRTCFRTYCECGWSGEAHWERSESISEWRQHVISHGGEWEDMAELRKRENQYRRKIGVEQI